jgi:hypothetical protein
MSDRANRAEVAAEFDVSLPTVDDWIRRGCPMISKGDKGRAAEFSLSAVRAWRASDVARQCYSLEELRILRDSGQEHLNSLRVRVEDSAKHFLWYSFTVGAEPLTEYLRDKQGLDELKAKKAVVSFYLHWAYIYEGWLSNDAYNRALRDSSAKDLDDEFCAVTLGCYKATSFPPSNFDINKVQLPAVIEHYLNEIASARQRYHKGDRFHNVNSR